MIADVTAADERHRVVGDQQFIVHSIVEPPRVESEVQLAQQPRVPSIIKWIENSHLDGRMAQKPQDLLIAGDRVTVIDEHANAHSAIRRAPKALGQHAAGFVAAKNIVLKIESSLSGIDQLHSELESVHADADDAKGRIALVFVGGAGKLLAKAGVLRVGERHGCGLGIIRTGRKPCATIEYCQGEQCRGMTADAPMRSTSLAHRRYSYWYAHAMVRLSCKIDAADSTPQSHAVPRLTGTIALIESANLT